MKQLHRLQVFGLDLKFEITKIKVESLGSSVCIYGDLKGSFSSLALAIYCHHPDVLTVLHKISNPDIKFRMLRIEILDTKLRILGDIV